MRKHYLKSILFILLISFYSCVKDKSSLGINELNEVTISGIADTITVSAGDTLKINPLLETVSGTGSAYNYLWYSFTTNMQYAADTLSKEKNLSTPVNLLPGTYSLVFRTMDLSTGIFYKRTVTMIVVNEYAPGIMILGEVNEMAVLHFFNTATGKYFPDVYKNSNDFRELGKNPVSVSYYPKNYQMPAEVLILCKDQDGGVVLNPITFQKTRSLRNSFIAPLEGSGAINVTRYVEKWGNLQDYVIINGRPHNRAINSGDLLFKPAMLGDYYVSSRVFNENASRPAFYDIQNRRFLAHNNTFGSLNTFLASATDNIINPNNVGLDIVYAGGVSATEFFGLFKSPSAEEYYILRMEINSLRLNFTAKEKYLVTSTDINLARVFASSGSLPDYLFYAIAGKCYIFNTKSKSGGLLFNMGAGYSIDLLKIAGKELRVGFRDENRSDKKAGFAIFNITTDGGIRATETIRKEGILDKIADMTNKD